jgi:lactoylglutathione lyase
MRLDLLSLAVTTIGPVAAAFAQAAESQLRAVFDHQALHVRDLTKSAAFYEHVLGLKRIPDPFKDDRHVWFDIGNGLELHVIGGAADVGKQDMDVHMAFSVPALEGFIERLDSLKIRYVNSRSEERKVTTRADGVKQVYFQDPDGYWIEVNDATRQ